MTGQQAREIFQLQNGHRYGSLHAASIIFAKQYHVSPKAIRDIWKGRSWLEATYALWDAAERPTRRIIGRPKGKKDSKPRKLKCISGFESLDGHPQPRTSLESRNEEKTQRNRETQSSRTIQEGIERSAPIMIKDIIQTYSAASRPAPEGLGLRSACSLEENNFCADFPNPPPSSTILLHPLNICCNQIGAGALSNSAAPFPYGPILPVLPPLSDPLRAQPFWLPQTSPLLLPPPSPWYFAAAEAFGRMVAARMAQSPSP